MTTEEQDERRKAAVQAFEQREAEAARAKADRDAAQKNRAAALAQESGAPTNVAASVTFYMREGMVLPNTDAFGCTLPAVPLDNVSEAWATSVADEVMFAVLRETSG